MTKTRITKALINRTSDITYLTWILEVLEEEGNYMVCNCRNFETLCNNNSTYNSLQERWELCIERFEELGVNITATGNELGYNWGDVIA